MKPAIANLWAGEWFTAARATRIWDCAAALLILLMALRLASDLRAPMLEAGGKPPSMDFVVFWSAGRQVLAHAAAYVYQRAPMLALQGQTVNLAPQQFYPFFYPPILLPFCAILALAPYLVALLALAATQVGLLASMLRRMLPAPWPVSTLVLAPGLLVSAAVGQTGSLMAVLYGWAMIWIDEKPFWAGACIGALAFKPHLAVLAPLVLLAARQWQAVLGAGCALAALVTISLVGFGTAPWLEFATAVFGAAQFQQHAEQVWPKMASVFTAVWFFGHHAAFAYGAQILVAAMAGFGVIKLSYKAGARAGLVLAAAATPLMVPHVFDYDLAITLPALAALMAAAGRTGWRGGEKLVASSVFLVPVLARPLGLLLGIGVAPVCIGAFVTLLYVRFNSARAHA